MADPSKEKKDKKVQFVCVFLDKLPLHIRQRIYRYLYARPAGIVPGVLKYRLERGGNVFPLYRYTWEVRRQEGYDTTCLPRYGGAPEQVMTNSWEPATEIEIAFARGGAFEYTNKGTWKMPATLDSTTGQTTEHELYEHGGFYAVMNLRNVTTTGIFGLALIRTNRQICKEATDILYGENNFVFDTRGPPSSSARGIHINYVGLHERKYIPGLRYAGGAPANQAMIDFSINEMLSKDVKNYRTPHFMLTDPLVIFFHLIGRENASKIILVQVEGFFKTGGYPGSIAEQPRLSFAQILPVYATILGNVCKDLKSLIIFQGKNDALWDVDQGQASGFTDAQRLDTVIADVVEKLPGLKQLLLECHAGRNDWGSVTEWESKVWEGAKE